MTAAAIPEDFAGYFDPALAEPLPEPEPATPYYLPARSAHHAALRLAEALLATRKAADVWLAMQPPLGPPERWSADQMARVNAGHELVDRALADYQRLREET